MSYRQADAGYGRVRMPGGYSLRSAATAFVPTDIAGVFLWLDADDASTITDAGAGAVSEWRDKSGNARHVSQATAGDRPTTGSVTVNGLNALAFAGDKLVRDPTTLVALGSHTRFIVATPSSVASRYLFQLLNKAGGAQFAFISAYSSVAYEEYAATVATVRYGIGPAGATGVNLLTTKRDGTAWASRFNGAASGSATSTSAALEVTAIGVGGSISDPGMTGTIAEILVYDSALSTEQVAQVESYLATKWGVTLA